MLNLFFIDNLKPTSLIYFMVQWFQIIPCIIGGDTFHVDGYTYQKPVFHVI